MLKPVMNTAFFAFAMRRASVRTTSGWIPVISCVASGGYFIASARMCTKAGCTAMPSTVKLPSSAGSTAPSAMVLFSLPIEPGRLDRLARDRVPHVEHVGLAVGGQIRLAQELPVVVSHEQHEVGLLLDEGGVVQPLVEQDLGQRQVEERVRARLDGDPQVGVNRARVVVGGDGDDAGAVVARLPDVVGVGDARRVGVEQRQHDVVGVEPGVGGEAREGVAVGEVGAGVEVAHVGEDVELDAAEERGQAVGGGEADVAQGCRCRCGSSACRGRAFRRCR